jgi:hypothetical protein
MIVLGSKRLLLNQAFYKAILWGSQKKNNGRLYVRAEEGDFRD